MLSFRKETRRKNWLKADSDAFKALKTIITSKAILKGLKNLTRFSPTGTLKIFHTLYNKWMLKNQHFLIRTWL